MCVQTRSPLASFRHGKPLASPSIPYLTLYLYLRLTQAKEAGASIVIDGKQVALGIPGGGKQADANKPVPGVPLGRGATPDEAANAVLL